MKVLIEHWSTGGADQVQEQNRVVAASEIGIQQEAIVRECDHSPVSQLQFKRERIVAGLQARVGHRSGPAYRVSQVGRDLSVIKVGSGSRIVLIDGEMKQAGYGNCARSSNPVA